MGSNVRGVSGETFFMKRIIQLSGHQINIFTIIVTLTFIFRIIMALRLACWTCLSVIHSPLTDYLERDYILPAFN